MPVMTKRRRRPVRSNPWPEKLRAIRATLQLTQADAAARVRVSQSIWSAWERGAKVPSESMQLLIDLTF